MRANRRASVSSSTGSPFQTMRSFTRSRCGLVYEPTESPEVSNSAAVMRATDVLPFVPVRWITGYDSCGDPRSRTSVSMRSSVGAVERRSAPGGRPVDSRLTWASSQARASSTFNSGRILGELDVDGEVLSLEHVDLAHPPCLLHVVECRLEGAQPLR